MRIDRRAFYSALQQLNRVADPKATLPILASVLIVAEDGLLTLTSTDLDRTLQAQVPAEGDLHACLPCRLLTQLLKPAKKSDRGEVILEQVSDNHVAVHVAGMESRLHTYSLTDFPAPPELDWQLVAGWPTDPLKAALEFILPAVSSDQTRRNLNSVLFSEDRLTSTDGHRLHQAALPASLAEPLLLPASAAKALKYILAASDQVFLARAGDFVRFKVGKFQFDARLLDEQFPKTDQVIPDPSSLKTRLVLDPAELTMALSQLAKLSPDKAVKFTVNGKCTLDAFDPDAGSASLAVPTIQNTHTGADLVVGFNGGYLIEAIKKAKAPVAVGLEDPLSPMRISREDGRLAIVMPMRI